MCLKFECPHGRSASITCIFVFFVFVWWRHCNGNVFVSPHDDKAASIMSGNATKYCTNRLKNCSIWEYFYLTGWWWLFCSMRNVYNVHSTERDAFQMKKRKMWEFFPLCPTQCRQSFFNTKSMPLSTWAILAVKVQPHCKLQTRKMPSSSLGFSFNVILVLGICCIWRKQSWSCLELIWQQTNGNASDRHPFEKSQIREKQINDIASHR